MGNKLKGRLLHVHRRPENSQVGDRVTFAEVQLGSSLQAWKDQIVGTIAEVLSTANEERRYVVDIFAPEQVQEDAMNPFLARYSSVQLRYVRGSRRCEFTAIGRKGTSFCSVPMAELHARGLGNAAHGRSARLGGLVSRQELEGLTGTVIAGPDHQGLYQMKMMIEDGELDTVVVNAENITLRLRRSALPELAQSVPAESHEAPLELEGVPFLAAVHQATRPSSTSPQRASARPKVRFCPTVSVEPISARSSRVVSLSAAAAECLVASGDVSQHALTEVSITEDCSGRDQKFEDLDNELSKYREGSGVASRLASTLALDPPLQKKS